MKVPEFKVTLVTVGNSKAFIVPAKTRKDYEIHDEQQYWVKLRKVEDGAE